MFLWCVLAGRNTAEEAAQRVREALMDPATSSRLRAVRRWAEAETDPSTGTPAPFPPNPMPEEDLAPMRPGGPLYNNLALDFGWWAQPQPDGPATGPGSGVISWSAMDMLFTERQKKLYAQDADIPKYEDTSVGRAAAAASAGAAGEEAAEMARTSDASPPSSASQGPAQSASS